MRDGVAAGVPDGVTTGDIDVALDADVDMLDGVFSATRMSITAALSASRICSGHVATYALCRSPSRPSATLVLLSTWPRLG